MDRVFINGIEIELTGDKSIALLYQSPFFTDIDAIVSNRTTSVEIPRTPNNIRAVEFAGILPGTSGFEYNAHKVVFLRDGVQLFTGTGTLLSIAPTAYKFTFAWGNIETLQQMLDTNLQDLQTEASGDYVGYNSTTASNNRTYYPQGWNTPSAWGVGVQGASVQPIMPVSEIMARIASRFGVSFSFPTGHSFNKYHIPLVTRYGDSRSAGWQGAIFVDVGFDLGRTNFANGGGLTYLAELSPDRVGGLDVGDGIIDTADIDSLTVQVPAGFELLQMSEGRADVRAGLAVYALSYEGVDAIATKLATVPMTRREQTAGFGDTEYIYTVERAYTTTIDVADYDEVVIAVAYKEDANEGDLENVIVQRNAGITVINPEADTVTFGGSSIIPLYANLPYMTVADLLKNLMKLEGVFAYSTTPQEVRFVSLDDVYTQRNTAEDWSAKVMGEPTEIASTFNSLAQRNWMRYAEDDSIKGNYDGYIVVYSALLDKESELLSVDFAPTEGNAIGVWVADENGDAEWNDVEPRILREQGGVIGFGGMAWDSLIASNYATYQRAVLRPRTVRASVHLTTADIVRYDPTTPIYVRQWGHYYAVIKLTTKENNTADVELLQLGNE